MSCSNKSHISIKQKLEPYRVVNCNTCPKSQCSGIIENIKRINKQTGMSGSMALYRRKALIVGRKQGDGNRTGCLSVSGPGDKQHSIEGTCPGNNCKGVTYRLPIAKTRTANKGKKGVDVKHNSYDRYLARRVGNVLNNESQQINKQINKRKGWQRKRTVPNKNCLYEDCHEYEYKNCRCGSKPS